MLFLPAMKALSMCLPRSSSNTLRSSRERSTRRDFYFWVVGRFLQPVSMISDELPLDTQMEMIARAHQGVDMLSLFSETEIWTIYTKDLSADCEMKEP